nr:competence protein CoiA family protein [Secundilactobacillus odoratitofui]
MAFLRSLVLDQERGSSMLVAHSTQKRQVVAKKANRQARYYCPGCGSSVILKRGTKMIAHFAHRTKTKCQVFSEAESQTHLMGKWQLATYLGTHRVKLEPYIASIQQRPDLMLYRDSSILAIEYQCATISVARLQSRTAGYRRVDIPVVWVLGPNYQHIDTITQAQAWLRYSSKWGWHLLFWHGPTQQLEIRHHIVFTVQARLHYQTTLENRPQTASQPSQEGLVKQFQKQIQMGLYYRTNKWTKLQTFCYQHRGLLQTIPTSCFSFTFKAPLICEPPVLWAGLMLILLLEQPVGTVISKSQLSVWCDLVMTQLTATQLVQCEPSWVTTCWQQVMSDWQEWLIGHQYVLAIGDDQLQILAQR